MFELFSRISASPLVLLIPLIACFVGWFTNVLAIKMMFYPTEFRGIKPFLGWQGLVPANARELGKFSTRLITEKLMPLEELFSVFDPEKFADSLDPIIDDITDQVVGDVQKRAPLMWDALAPEVQDQVRGMIRTEVKSTLAGVLTDLKANIHEVVDLEEVVTDAIEEDRGLVSEMFLRVGTVEFKFIERSGAWFGLLFGLIQMLVWVFYPAWWMLPLAGFLVGYATNWLALKLIFEPAEARKVGPWTIQGVFHKRQREVAAAFSTLVTAKVLNADNIVKSVLATKRGDRIFEIIEARLDGLFEKYAAHPMASAVLPESEHAALKAEMMQRVRDQMPAKDGFLHTFAGRAVDIQGQMFERMAKLDAKSFEGVLRPAFEADEWKLIVAGAALGLAAGTVQLVTLFSDALQKVS